MCITSTNNNQIELIYMYIESYRVLKKKEFVLSSSYHIAQPFTEKFNKIFVHLSEDNIVPDHVIYGTNIQVTAIVGDNGVGKSTILDCIRLIMRNTKANDEDIKGFMIFKQNGRYWYICSHFNPHIHLILSGENKEREIEEGTTVLSNGNWCSFYYSNIIDLYHLQTDYRKGLHAAVSQNKIASKMQYMYYDISTNTRLREADLDFRTYFSKEFESQLLFCSDRKNSNEFLKDFFIPHSMELTFVLLKPPVINSLDVSLHNWLDQMDKIYTSIWAMQPDRKTLAEEEYLNISTYRNALSQIRNHTALFAFAPQTAIQWNLLMLFCDKYGNTKNTVSNCLKRRELFSLDEDSLKTKLHTVFFGTSIDSEDELSPFINFYRNWHELFYSADSGSSATSDLSDCSDDNFEIDVHIEPYTIIRKYYNDTRDQDKPVINSVASSNKSFSYSLDYSELHEYYLNKRMCSFDHFKQFILDLRKIYEGPLRLFQINCTISSGEYEYLCLFSRLYDYMENWRENHKNLPAGSFVLLLDELDSSFHPRWQQNVLWKLTSFINKYYPDWLVQIIFTTHSPVVLSDILVKNTIFLKVSERREKISAMPSHKQTFAANIATLYYDSFFMEKGSIGNVAGNFVRNVLKALNETEVNKVDQFLDKYGKLANIVIDKTTENQKNVMQEFKAGIQAIGEEFIQNKLMQKFITIFPEFTDNTDTDEAIAQKLIGTLQKKYGENKTKEIINILKTIE